MFGQVVSATLSQTKKAVAPAPFCLCQPWLAVVLAVLLVILKVPFCSNKIIRRDSAKRHGRLQGLGYKSRHWLGKAYCPTREAAIVEWPCKSKASVHLLTNSAIDEKDSPIV